LKVETLRSRIERKMRMIFLPAERVLALLASSISALDTLFETIEETQSLYVSCVNPNDSQLPNQFEGRSVKGQVKAVGMTEMARRCVNVFEVGVTWRNFAIVTGMN
jgi:myosin heavy subunit